MRPEAIIIADNPDVDYRPGFSLTLAPPDWLGYSHELRDVGWFWQASFNLARPDDEIEEFFETGLNRAVEVYSRRGLLIWEGWISEMTLRRGASEMRRGFGKMANRVWMRYSDSVDSGLRSTPVEDAASIALYGIKDKPLGGGQMLGEQQAIRVATTYLNMVRFPENPSISATGGRAGSSRRPQLEIRCSGWWHKLYWRVFNDPNPGGTSRTLTAQVQKVFTEIAWPVAGEYDYNGAPTPSAADADMWAADVLLNSAKQGDINSDRWIVGIGPRRKPYYRRATATRLPEAVE